MIIIKNFDINKIENSQELYANIAIKKEELNELVLKYGISHELSIAKSQELDLELNKTL